MQTVSGYNTRMGVGTVSTTQSGIQENDAQRQDAPFIANGIMELKTHNCLVLFCFAF